MQPSEHDDGHLPKAGEVTGEGAESMVPPLAKHFSGRQAARGALWTLIGYGLVQVIRFGSSIVITRLILPYSYGVMAMVWSVMMGISLFSDLGIGANIVQSKRGEEPAFRNTAWTFQILRGLVITLVAWFIAPLVAAIYPKYLGLGGFIQGIAVSAFILGLGSMSIHILRRNMSVERLVILEVSAQILATTMTVIWACYDPTPWAMVAGAIVSTSTTTIASHIFFGGDRLGWDRPSVAELFKFGKWVFISTALMFLAGQADRLIFGCLIPPELLGVYGVALMVARIIPELAAKLVGSVAYPILCRTSQLGQPIEPVFVRCSRPIFLLGGWALAGLCGGGDAAVSFLYSAEYAGAGWILQLIAAGAWFGSVLKGSRSSALIAMGLPRLASYTSLAKLIGMVVLIPAGFHLADFPGAVVGYVLSDSLLYLAAAWACRSVGLGALGVDVRFSLWFGVTSLASWGAAHFMSSWGYAPWLQCVAVFVVDSLLWVPLLLPLWREVKALFAREA
jgi:O-antigen/teichoic acid export membrane protein